MGSFRGWGALHPGVVTDTKQEHPTAKGQRPGQRSVCMPREKQPAANPRRAITEGRVGRQGSSRKRGSQRERGLLT